MKKLFIGSLPFSLKEERLEELFSEVGKVESAIIIKDKMTGRSKGFAFVEMSSEEEASKAIEKFNGFNLEGRNIVVNKARPQSEAPRRF